MIPQTNASPNLRFLLFGSVLVCCALYFVSVKNYLLFHSLIELYTVIVSGCLFVIAWNTRRYHESNTLVFIGLAFIFIGFVDLLHTLAYEGIGIFPGSDANRASQVWLIARGLESMAFLIAALLAEKRPMDWGKVTVGFSLVTGGLLALFLLGKFPTCFVPGRGLTAFKVTAEVAIIVLLILAIVLFWRRQRLFHKAITRLIILALLCTIASEISFTFYHSVTDFPNTLGHFFKLASYALLYKAFIEMGLNQPFRLLFFKVKQTEVALRRERDFFSNVIDSSGGLLLVLDPHGRIVRFNLGCEILTGYTFDEVRGKPLWSIIDSADDAATTKERVEQLRLSDFPAYHESTWVTKSGETRIIAWASTALFDSVGAVEYIIASGADITRHKQMEEHLHRQSLIDPLTGLYNRRGFLAVAEQRMKLVARMHWHARFIFCDLDAMKIINDQFGHKAGDEALQATAAILRATFRDSDILARFGGDEFVVLAVEQFPRSEHDLLQRITQTVEHYRQEHPHPFPLSLSVGSTLIDPAAMDDPAAIDTWIHQADVAMYEEKKRKQAILN